MAKAYPAAGHVGFAGKGLLDLQSGGNGMCVSMLQCPELAFILSR